MPQLRPDNVERARFDRQFVQDVHVVHFSVRNTKKTGDISAQIEQRVKFDGSLPASKRGPGKQRETQVDGCRIQSTDRPVQVDSERLVAIKFSRAPDECLREVSVNAPVAIAVGVGQCAACNATAKSHVIKFRLDRSQTGFDVAQTFAVSQLCKRHHQKLIATREVPCSNVASIAPDALVEIVPRKEFHELCEDQRATVYRPSPAKRKGHGNGLLSLAS